MTTSQEVARIFGKRQHDVLKAIRNPVIPEDFSESNFAYVEIIEKNASNLEINKSYFKMTRDGFNLIAMGFTGSRAMRHKIDFIYAFNFLEAEAIQRRRRLEASMAPEQPQIEAPGTYVVIVKKSFRPACSTWTDAEIHRGNHGAENATQIERRVG